MPRPTVKQFTRAAAFAAVVTCGLAPRPAPAAGLLVADGGLGGQLEIKDHDVHVTVNNGVAVTTVDQTFHNTEQRTVEALYTFPVPKGASVSNFSMWINGREMVGEVVEKKRAREIYNSYKQQPKPRDPGLLEQVDYRTFEMRVFPIQANADQHVRVTYYQELTVDHDRATYVYPLATSTRPGVATKTTGKFALSFEAKNEVPITKLESPSHAQDFVVAKHTDHYRQASMEVTGGDLAKDVVLAFDTARPKTGLDLVCSRPAGEDGYFSLSLTAGDELKALNKPMDYVFVLDVSGSMRDDNKLGLSTQSLNQFVSALGPDDRFEVMTFNVQASTLFNAMTPATDDAKQKSADFLASRRAVGGTVLNGAMRTAYKYAETGRPLNVVILSDGLTETNERTELVNLIRQRPADARVFAIGVGNDVNRGLLEQLADDSGGLAAFVSPADDLRAQAQAFRRKLMHPVVDNLAIKVDGVDAYDVQPAKLPNLYFGMPVRLYGRYKGSGPGHVTVSGSVAGHPITQAVDLQFAKADDNNPEIERMWAWKKVDALLKQGDASGDRNTVADEVVRLGEAYSIASEYTSFLVLENNAEFQRWHIAQRNATRLARDRVAQQKVRDELDGLKSADTADLGPAGAEKTTVVAAAPAAAPQLAPQASAPVSDAPQEPTGRSRDLGFSSGGGHGGAIDPVTALLAAASAATAWRVRRHG